MKTVEHKKERYLAQNQGAPLTVAQKRQLRKTETRLAHEKEHGLLRERQRNARQRVRDWLAGMKG